MFGTGTGRPRGSSNRRNVMLIYTKPCCYDRVSSNSQHTDFCCVTHRYTNTAAVFTADMRSSPSIETYHHLISTVRVLYHSPWSLRTQMPLKNKGFFFAVLQYLARRCSRPFNVDSILSGSKAANPNLFRGGTEISAPTCLLMLIYLESVAYPDQGAQLLADADGCRHAG